jgi:hypothetical protein
MYSIVGNVYKGQGIVWVVNTISKEAIKHLEGWKFSQHGSFETKEEAETIAKQLNKLFDTYNK